MLIRTSDLTKTVQTTTLLKNVNLLVREGRIYALLGPNGSGKTTLLKTLIGLVKQSSGTIHLDSSVQNSIGVLIENPSLYDQLNAYENLKIFCLLHNTSPDRINKVLQLLNLETVGSKKVAQFSLGMKQRLAIAAALLHQPKLLILDEPTNGLDPEGVQSLRKFIKSLPSKLGTTVILASHMLHEVEQLADDVGIMNHGMLTFQGSLQQLKKTYPKANNLEDIFMTITKN